MAGRSCPRCGAAISGYVEICPSCGMDRPVPLSWPVYAVMAILVAGLFLLLADLELIARAAATLFDALLRRER